MHIASFFLLQAALLACHLASHQHTECLCRLGYVRDCSATRAHPSLYFLSPVHKSGFNLHIPSVVCVALISALGQGGLAFRLPFHLLSALFLSATYVNRPGTAALPVGPALVAGGLRSLALCLLFQDKSLMPVESNEVSTVSRCPKNNLK